MRRPPILIGRDPPSFMAPTASLVRFRELTRFPLLEATPDDPNIPKFLRAVEVVLAWRATIAPGDRFWREVPKLIKSDILHA
jgi:hypothetical protein